jgi:hypothetical protein
MRLLAIVLAIGVSALVIGDAAPAAPASIPAGVRAALLKEARTVAAKEADRHPYDIQAVRTTRLRALRLERDVTMSSCEVTPSCANAPVYVLAMRGRFSCNTCKLPPPHGKHRGRGDVGLGSVITLEFAAKEPLPRWGQFGFGNRYPNLKALGLPVRLGARPTHRSR